MADLVKRLEALARSEHDDLTVASEAASRIKELEGEVLHWRANHDEMVKRNALLRDRPDLPLERTKAYEEFVTDLDAALADNERLREALKEYEEELCEGWCNDVPARCPAFWDCCGCRARVTLWNTKGDTNDT